MASLAAFSSFHGKIPGAVWYERRDWSAEDSTESLFQAGCIEHSVVASKFESDCPISVWC